MGSVGRNENVSNIDNIEMVPKAEPSNTPAKPNVASPKPAVQDALKGVATGAEAVAVGAVTTNGIGRAAKIVPNAGVAAESAAVGKPLKQVAKDLGGGNARIANATNRDQAQIELVQKPVNWRVLTKEEAAVKEALEAVAKAVEEVPADAKLSNHQIKRLKIKIGAELEKFQSEMNHYFNDVENRTPQQREKELTNLVNKAKELLDLKLHELRKAEDRGEAVTTAQILGAIALVALVIALITYLINNNPAGSNTLSWVFTGIFTVFLVLTIGKLDKLNELDDISPEQLNRRIPFNKLSDDLDEAVNKKKEADDKKNIADAEIQKKEKEVNRQKDLADARVDWLRRDAAVRAARGDD